MEEKSRMGDKEPKCFNRVKPCFSKLERDFGEIDGKEG